MGLGRRRAAGARARASERLPPKSTNRRLHHHPAAGRQGPPSALHASSPPLCTVAAGQNWTRTPGAAVGLPPDRCAALRRRFGPTAAVSGLQSAPAQPLHLLCASAAQRLQQPVCMQQALGCAQAQGRALSAPSRPAAPACRPALLLPLPPSAQGAPRARFFPCPASSASCGSGRWAASALGCCVGWGCLDC